MLNESVIDIQTNRLTIKISMKTGIGQLNKRLIQIKKIDFKMKSDEWLQ